MEGLGFAEQTRRIGVVLTHLLVREALSDQALVDSADCRSQSNVCGMAAENLMVEIWVTLASHA